MNLDLEHVLKEIIKVTDQDIHLKLAEAILNLSSKVKILEKKVGRLEQ